MEDKHTKIFNLENQENNGKFGLRQLLKTFIFAMHLSYSIPAVSETLDETDQHTL